MHCQKPEQQLKSILHRRTTPNSSKPKPDFQAQDTGTPQRLDRKTTSLNFEKDDQKLWRLTKQFSDEGNFRAKIILEENSRLLTGKQAADMFAEKYANESKTAASASKQRGSRRETREIKANRTTVKPMQQPLRLCELHRALKKLKQRR